MAKYVLSAVFSTIQSTGTCIQIAAAVFEVENQQGDIGRTNPANATCLTESTGANPHKFFAGLCAQLWDS
jgi:hypothetical protein